MNSYESIKKDAMKRDYKEMSQRSPKRKMVIRALITVGAFLLAVTAGAFYWLNDGYDPMEEAIEALEGTEVVEVYHEDRWVHFQPQNERGELDSRVGFMYYPGARVDYRSYAPLMQDLAREGVDGFLVEMPFSLAIFGSDRGEEIIENHPEIEHWIIGGHSLGGAMAARFAYNHRDMIDGLVLFAAYPASSNDLSDFENLSVLSIYADRDGFATNEDIENSREYVPGNTQWLEIEGGNHSQFGYYGFQSGDLEAEISREEQQAQIIEGILNWLE